MPPQKEDCDVATQLNALCMPHGFLPAAALGMAMTQAAISAKTAAGVAKTACQESTPGSIWQRQRVGSQASHIVWYNHGDPSVVYFVIKPPDSCHRTARDGFFSLDDLLRTLRHRRQ